MEEVKTGCSIVRETMYKIKYHVDGDLQPDIPTLKTMWNMLSEALDSIEKPASPPSMPDDTVISDWIESFCSYERTDEVRQMIKVAKWMRSKCEGLIKQKDDEIKSLKMEMVGLFKLDHVNELLGDASKRAYIAAGGTEKEWKDWQNKANKLNVN